MAEDLSLAIQIQTDMQGAVKDVRQLRNEVGGVEESGKRGAQGVNRLNRSLGSTGGQLQTVTRLAGAASAAIASIGAGLAVKQSVEQFAALEQGLINVQKVTGLSDQRIEGLKASIQEMATQVPVATNELTDIAAAAGRLGVSGQGNILAFTETVAKLGRTTDLQGEEAATTLARILNITGESPQQVEALGSAMVALGNNAAASESEIANAANEIARGTAAMEVSSTQAVGLGAAMAEMGVRAETGGTAIQRTFQELKKFAREGGDELQQMADLTGQSMEEVRQSLEENPVQFLADFLGGISKTGRDSTAVLEEFGLASAELTKTLNPLISNTGDLRDHLARANEEAGKGTALQQEFEKAISTLQGELDLLGTTLGVAYEKVGEELAPSVRELSEDLRSFLNNEQQVEDFAEAVKGLAEGFMTLAKWGGKAAQAVTSYWDTAAQNWGEIVWGANDARQRIENELEAMRTKAVELQNDIDAEKQKKGTWFFDADELQKNQAELERTQDRIDTLEGSLKAMDKAAQAAEDSQKGAAEGSKEAAEASEESAEASEDDAEAKDKQRGAIEAAGTSAQAFNRALREATQAAKSPDATAQEWQRLAEQTRDAVDPMRSVKTEMRQVQDLMDRGDISPEVGMERLMQLQQELDKAGVKTEELGDEAKETGDDMSEFAIQARRNIESELADTLVDTMNGSYDSILEGWTRMIQQMVAEAAAAEIMDSLTGEGGEGGLLDAGLNALTSYFSGGSGGGGSAGTAHTGGIAGQAMPQTSVNPAIFAGAPRYATGGIAGLKPDEVPIVAHKGEEVLTREDPRHRANGGQAAGPTIGQVVVQSSGNPEQDRRSGAQAGKEAARQIKRAETRNL